MWVLTVQNNKDHLRVEISRIKISESSEHQVHWKQWQPHALAFCQPSLVWCVSFQNPWGKGWTWDEGLEFNISQMSASMFIKAGPGLFCEQVRTSYFPKVNIRRRKRCLGFTCRGTTLAIRWSKYLSTASTKPLWVVLSLSSGSCSSQLRWKERRPTLETGRQEDRRQGESGPGT